jgi:hypothetical protein
MFVEVQVKNEKQKNTTLPEQFQNTTLPEQFQNTTLPEQFQNPINNSLKEATLYT